jgi:hypothetical protein
MTNKIWIKDHITAYDLMNCPHCGAEAEILDFSLLHSCPLCFRDVTFAEWSQAIDKAALTQIFDGGDIPGNIKVSEEKARQFLGKAEYQKRKSRGD